MIKQLWINLPVKDIDVSKTFFTNIGFDLNTKHDPGPDAASFFVGNDKYVLMLFKEEMFGHIVQHAVSDTSKGTEVMLSFDAASRQEVDDLARKVKEAGGNLFAPPTEIQGWMYGCAFADPDGHRWNVLFMDTNG